MWDKETYGASVSSGCWAWTPYCAGWDHSVDYGADLRVDPELKAIVEMEHGLGGVPEWAIGIVRGCIANVAPCGHITFPRPYLEVVEAIGKRCDAPVHTTCYVVDELVLFRISRLVGLMEDWVAGRTAATPGAEGLWEVLGERSRAKEVLVKRFAYQLRWLHANVLAPDRIGPVLRDPELGTWTDDLDLVAVNGNRQLGPLPGYLPDTSPVMSDMDDELRRILPGWDSLRDRIVNQTWPCAPKAFRYYERILYGIGRLRRAPDDEPVPRFLGGLGNGPDKGACREWWVADGSRVPFPFRAGFVGV